MGAMIMPFEVRDARQLQGAGARRASSSSRSSSAKDAGYATDIRVRRYESAEQDPLTARRLALLRRMAGRVPPPVAIGQRGPGLHAHGLRRAQPVALLELRRQGRGDELRLHPLRAAAVLPAHVEHLQRAAEAVQPVLGRDVLLLTVTFDPGARYA